MRTLDAITADALALPVAERAALVLRLAESLDERFDPDAGDAWATEVDARVGVLRAGLVDTTTTAAALAEARAHLAARRR
ncbi:MAG TPA: addiction module protein [Polyangiaceae bacterium]|jgi:hypothetical protein